VNIFILSSEYWFIFSKENLSDRWSITKPY